eukprot:TCONS_00057882-protein
MEPSQTQSVYRRMCNTHTSSPSKLSYGGILDDAQLNLILLCDEYGLENLYRMIMIQNPRVDLASIKDNYKFHGLHLLTRYELIRNSVIQMFQKKSHSIAAEVEDIFNFYDVLLYENRTPDISVKKPFRENASFNFDPKEKEKFLAEPADDRFVVLIVEGMKLHVDSFTLVNQSPVFKEILEIAPRNKSGKKTLPGQGVNEVAHLLTFLTEPREIEAQNTDLMALANLAQEYQIALLKNKIRIFLENIKEEKAEEQLKYLKLVNMMNFSQIVQFKIFAQIGKGFRDID